MSRTRRSKPPLPQLEGIDPIRYVIEPSTPTTTAVAALARRFPQLEDPAARPLLKRFAAGEIVRSDGSSWTASDHVRPGDALWFHREFAPETVEPVHIPVLYRDERLLVVDKPAGLATIPRGEHIRASVLARLRRHTGLPELSPVHRLDRLTSGVLVFTIHAEHRSAYQRLFAARHVTKEYRALIHRRANCTLPQEVGKRATLRDHLHKPPGSMQVIASEDPPNAETTVQMDLAMPWPPAPHDNDLEHHDSDLEHHDSDLAHHDSDLAHRGGDVAQLLTLWPVTGRTHQLRVQLALRGGPIVGDDLYPEVLTTAQEWPLQLLANRLAFRDPFTGADHDFQSARDLPITHEPREDRVVSI